ncbi:hypothetical protein GGS21DRAFT_210954 [Xylaria nigripes]|nr:hypothetical protein GGS21DRAFT_210954 [Xylaria nigripes]
MAVSMLILTAGRAECQVIYVYKHAASRVFCRRKSRSRYHEAIVSVSTYYYTCHSFRRSFPRNPPCGERSYTS